MISHIPSANMIEWTNIHESNKQKMLNIDIDLKYLRKCMNGEIKIQKRDPQVMKSLQKDMIQKVR